MLTATAGLTAIKLSVVPPAAAENCPNQPDPAVPVQFPVAEVVAGKEPPPRTGKDKAKEAIAAEVPPETETLPENDRRLPFIDQFMGFTVMDPDAKTPPPPDRVGVKDPYPVCCEFIQSAAAVGVATIAVTTTRPFGGT